MFIQLLGCYPGYFIPDLVARARLLTSPRHVSDGRWSPAGAPPESAAPRRRRRQPVSPSLAPRPRAPPCLRPGGRATPRPHRGPQQVPRPPALGAQQHSPASQAGEEPRHGLHERLAPERLQGVLQPLRLPVQEEPPRSFSARGRHAATPERHGL